MRPDFEVTIIGNTSSIPVHGRHHTAQVVRFAQDLLLLDCGESTQIQLRALHIKTSKISHIFISHLHGDHYLGLVGLLSSFHLSNRKTPITIFGPQGLDEIITTQFRWSNTRLSYPLHFHQTDPDGFKLLVDMPGYQVYSFPLKHRLPTTGFLIKEKRGLYSLIKEKLNEKKLPLEAIQSLRNGIDYISSDGDFYLVNEYCHPHPPLRSYAFCSDTKFDPELSQYIKGVDTLYHESTFMENLKERAELTQHSTAMEAAEIAKIAGVKQLLLGHFSSRYVNLQPLLLEAQSIFPKSILSVEGETYTL
ncbi:ribonuclease Z [Algoriphagus sp. CAU 1675]|uniref:ribonuclease Z n=1 Tax=Algoriphagus sp. CAU 1675 TaxID=3032597 RepID=UPI0023DCAB05|nr:ribonuclease Z [Algoriphagus sp. CAU 1675]MDF2158240.1 ribonuclease Z [Algoriphagus sp. CAU 1675]